MTIFHKIKYANIDIHNKNELDKLPLDIYILWLGEIKEFSIELLKSLSYIKTEDTIVQNVTEAVDFYFKGEISEAELDEAVHSITKNTLRDDDKTENHPDRLKLI